MRFDRSVADPVVINYSASWQDLVGKFRPVFEWRLSERQVCRDLARNVVAGECLHGIAGLSCWWFEHTNTEQCARIRKGGLKKGQRQGVRAWCMTASVFVAHTASLCALSLVFQPLFSCSLYLPRQICFCLRSSRTVCVSSGMISIYSTIFKFTSVDISECEISQLMAPLPSEGDLLFQIHERLLPLVISCILLSNNFSTPKVFLKKRLMLSMMLVAIQ